MYPVTPLAVVVRVKQQFQSVHIYGRKLMCDCAGHHAGCKFTEAVKKRLQDEEDEELASFRANLECEDGEIRYQQTSISTTQLEFCG